MKYEIILGDERLFDGASEFVEVVRFNDYSRDYLWGDLNTIQLLTFEELKAIPIVAMRRIIQEPKRWTVEDQKAGRLPEVGCRVNFCHKLNANWRIGEIKYMDDQVVVIKVDDVDRPFVYEVDRVEFKPIEVSEEKAARLKSEWCAKAAKQLKNLEYTSTLTSIYDALLSGELQAPTKGE